MKYTNVGTFYGKLRDNLHRDQNHKDHEFQCKTLNYTIRFNYAYLNLVPTAYLGPSYRLFRINILESLKPSEILDPTTSRDRR